MKQFPGWYIYRERRASPSALLRAFGATEPPVDVFGLASWLGIEVVRQSGLGISGWCQGVDDPPFAYVEVNADDSPQRQRFTLAHEIGHLMYHPLGVQHRDPDLANRDYREVTANGFAARLLMPEHMVRIGYFRIGMPVELLAAEFDVSVSAMKHRIADIKSRSRR